MLLFKLFSSLVIFLSCENDSSNYIKIIGKAIYLKDGVAVISKKDKRIYYLEGVHFWGKNIEGKTVEVTGILYIQNKPEPNPEQEIAQDVIGEKRILKKPKWKVL